jgi:hypothetical protein
MRLTTLGPNPQNADCRCCPDRQASESVADRGRELVAPISAQARAAEIGGTEALATRSRLMTEAKNKLFQMPTKLSLPYK